MEQRDPSTRSRKLLPGEFERETLFISLTFNNWSLQHLAGIYRAFKGDFVKAMVLGEITHHCLSAMAPALDYDTARVRAAIADPSSPHKLLPCNSFSVSQATGLPRETVRRKVDALVAEGLLTRSGSGDLFVQIRPGAYGHFFDFTFQSANTLIEVADRICERALGGTSLR